MLLSNRNGARLLALSILTLALFSIVNPLGRGQISPISPILPSSTIRSDSLSLTVNPDKSVGVDWNTVTNVTIPQSIAMSFPAGYAIHSSSNFTQQANAVVQTTTFQYQIPTQVYIQQPLLSTINSFNLTASQNGLTGQGSLVFDANLPIQHVNIVYSTNSSLIRVNATAQLYFSPAYSPTAFSNETAFQTFWNQTFGSSSWRASFVSEIQNSTSHVLTVTAFDTSVTYPTLTSASVKIGFIAIPSGSATDFITAFEKALAGGMSLPAGFDNIIRSALNLVTGETASLTYSAPTKTVSFTSTTNYVSNLDVKLNSLKTQFFQLLFTLAPAGTVFPPLVSFLNSTSVTISKTTITSNLDLSSGTYRTSLSGLSFIPQTKGSNTNFTIPGLFQAISTIPSPGVNFTLVGGSNSTYSVKIVVPPNTPQPSSTTSNSATWTNLQDVSTLSAVQFQLQRSSGGLLAFLVSPLGIAIEAIIAIAIVATVVLYMTKRRAAKTPLPMTPAPAPSPGLGPSPAPPAP